MSKPIHVELRELKTLLAAPAVKEEVKETIKKKGK